MIAVHLQPFCKFQLALAEGFHVLINRMCVWRAVHLKAKAGVCQVGTKDTRISCSALTLGVKACKQVKRMSYLTNMYRTWIASALAWSQTKVWLQDGDQHQLECCMTEVAAEMDMHAHVPSEVEV